MRWAQVSRAGILEGAGFEVHSWNSHPGTVQEKLCDQAHSYASRTFLIL